MVIRFLATFALTLLASIPGQTQNTKDEVHLWATVQDVAPLAGFSGQIIPVDFDPRFALTVRIQSVDPAVGSLTAGPSLHSPFTARHYYLEKLPPKVRPMIFRYKVRLSMARRDSLD